MSVLCVTDLFGRSGGYTTGGVQRKLKDRIFWASGAESYAKTIGLHQAIHGLEPGQGSAPGKSYSCLTRLEGVEAIEQCSGVINDFIYDSLGDHHRPLAIEAARVVGELHDNVSSHARGVGFSAAQTYGDRIEIAIADAGCGMLFNVRQHIATIRNHTEAIEWCLVRGHTTAGDIEVPGTPPAQWLPSDATSNPFPDSLRTTSSRNHHLGEGLWLLSELVNATGGSLWIWSGDAQITINATGRKRGIAPRKWNGVAIEITLPLVSGRVSGTVSPDAKLEELARRLGL